MNAYRKYAQTQVETASPERTLAMLLDGARTRIRNGVALLEKGQRIPAVGPLTRACDIVLELERTLRPDLQPELTTQLAQLYQFVALRLTNAAAKGDIRAAREAEKVFLPIAEGFLEAIAKKEAAPAK